MERELNRRRWPLAVALVFILLSLGCGLIPDWAYSAPTSVYLDFTPPATQSDVEFWATAAPDFIPTDTPTPEPVPALDDPCAMLPDESNRTITGSRPDCSCTADHYGTAGEAHSWLGGIRLDKYSDAHVAQEQLEKVLEEEWEWKPVTAIGDAAFEYRTGKAIAYHVRYRRGPVVFQVQAGEGQIRLMTTLAVEIDERIQSWLE